MYTASVWRLDVNFQESVVPFHLAEAVSLSFLLQHGLVQASCLDDVWLPSNSPVCCFLPSHCRGAGITNA